MKKQDNVARVDHWELSDDEFRTQFESANLQASLFTHEAHMRLAWIYIQSLGKEEATNRLRKYLINFTRKIGADDKYNETLTVAAVLVMDHFMKKKNISSFQELLKTFPRLQTSFKELLLQHYTTDIFNDPEAKKNLWNQKLSPLNKL